MSQNTAIDANVHFVQDEADDIKIYEIRRTDGRPMPSFTPGAHVDLHLPGISRSYSLISDPDDLSNYRVAVALNRQGRGGSQRIHDEIRSGSALRISQPRNMFSLDETAAKTVFIAGGIGITPIFTMIRRMEALGKAWALHYAARSRSTAAMLNELLEIKSKSSVGTVSLYFKNEPDGGTLRQADIVRERDADTHFYCCGPDRMLTEFETIVKVAGIPTAFVHVERFGAAVGTTPSDAFRVLLAKSKIELTVAADQSILDVARAAGVNVSSSCEQGVCGECEARVISGIPDHRDFVLSERERASNSVMMICCSRAKTDELVLNL